MNIFLRKNITENTLPKITTENSYAYAFNDTIVCLEKNELTFYTKSANKLKAQSTWKFQIPYF